MQTATEQIVRNSQSVFKPKVKLKENKPNHKENFTEDIFSEPRSKSISSNKKDSEFNQITEKTIHVQITDVDVQNHSDESKRSKSRNSSSS